MHIYIHMHIHWLHIAHWLPIGCLLIARSAAVMQNPRSPCSGLPLPGAGEGERETLGDSNTCIHVVYILYMYLADMHTCKGICMYMYMYMYIFVHIMNLLIYTHKHIYNIIYIYIHIICVYIPPLALDWILAHPHPGVATSAICEVLFLRELLLELELGAKPL